MDSEDSTADRRVLRQQLIFEVAREARGRPPAEIKAMLREAFARHDLPAQPGSWLDAVASEASYGKAYVIDIPSAAAADRSVGTPDAAVADDIEYFRGLDQPAVASVPGASAAGATPSPGGAGSDTDGIEGAGGGGAGAAWAGSRGRVFISRAAPIAVGVGAGLVLGLWGARVFGGGRR